jgi:hypothetical protein
MRSVARHPAAIFGKADRFGAAVPNYVKECKCLCGTWYYVGFYRKDGQYKPGLLVDKKFLAELDKKNKQVEEEESKRKVQAKHDPEARDPFIGYKDEELKIPIPPEIEMMDRPRLNSYALQLGVPSIQLGVDDDSLKKLVAMEEERKRIKTERGKICYMKGLGKYKQEKDKSNDTAEDGVTIPIVEGDVKPESPTDGVKTEE